MIYDIKRFYTRGTLRSIRISRLAKMPTLYRIKLAEILESRKGFISGSQLSSTDLVESKMANIERKFKWVIVNYCISLFSVFPSFKFIP